MDYGLLKQYEPLYVIGHKNPDIDSVVSSILLCNILKSHDIECYPCFLDNNYEIEEQSKKMIDDCASLNMKILSSDELDNLVGKKLVRDAKADFLLEREDYE